MEKALRLMAGQCSRREMCRADVVAKLRQWELSEWEIEEVMDFLERQRFVDDVRFARAYVQDKFRFRRWGKLKIEQQLRQKQLPAPVIAEALAALPEESYDETCLSLLRQKDKSLKEPDPYKRRAKLCRFALGRGFDYEVVARCVERILA